MLIRHAIGAIALMMIASASSFAQANFTTAVESVEARFEPAQAQPGQTVTLKLTVTLKPGWHTYPTVQPDENARAQSNKIGFPTAGAVIFVDKLQEPANPESKAEPVLDIQKLLFYSGKATWERKAIVALDATGELAIKLPNVKLMVCDENTCLPPKTVPVTAKLTVAGAPVAIEARYRDEVAKALQAKPTP